MSTQSTNLLFILAMMAIFYFLILRPQQKRARAQREMLAALTPGDEIVTVGGIYATVVSTGDRVRVRVADGSELEVALQAIGRIVSSASDTGDEDADVITEADVAGDSAVGEGAGAVDDSGGSGNR